MLRKVDARAKVAGVGGGAHLGDLEAVAQDRVHVVRPRAVEGEEDRVVARAEARVVLGLLGVPARLELGVEVVLDAPDLRRLPAAAAPRALGEAEVRLLRRVLPRLSV